MSEAMFQHERAQYAVYGLMLLVSLDDGSPPRGAGAQARTILAQHPGAPATTLGFAEDGKLSWAANVVPDPETALPIEQRFTFSGERISRDVHRPARIEISQNGRRYFDLRISEFFVET